MSDTSIKNGDLPAIPQPCATNENGDMVSISEWTGEVGLTKRETFAMNAPTMPDWFKSQYEFAGLDAASVLSPKEMEDFGEYCADNYGYSRYNEGEDASNKFGVLFRNAASSHNKDLFFKWQVFYADALLTQLEDKGE